VEFRGRVIKVKIAKDRIDTVLESGDPMEIVMGGKVVKL
jgi:maltose phosphorylase